MRKIQDLYTKNYKTSLKELQKMEINGEAEHVLQSEDSIV